MDRKGTEMFLSLLQGTEVVSKFQGGDEQKSINRAENHARSAIISSTMSLETMYLTNYDAERDK